LASSRRRQTRLRRGARALARGLAAPVAALLLGTGVPAHLAAQQLILSGRILHVEARDTVPARGLMVVAHEVGAARQGPIDSAPADPQGRFRFRVAAPESATVYVVSARWAGIGYFSQPFDSADRAGSDSISLMVFDTASSGEPLAVGTRHVVITRAAADGSRHVLDIAQIENNGQTTRVGSDSLATTWRMRLPDHVANVAAGEGDVSPESMRFDSGWVLVAAPFPPGEKQVAVTYDLPASRTQLVIPIDQPTAQLEVLAEDSLTSALAVVQRSDPLQVEDRVFQRFVASNLAAGAQPAVSLARLSNPVRTFWWIPVLSATLLLAVGAAYAASRRVARR